MKKLIFIAVLIQITSFAFSQPLKKGNLIGTHIMELKLQPGVTMEQFLDFYMNKAIPVLEQNHKGWKYYPLKYIRGEKPDGLGAIVVIESEKDRDKYYKPDGTSTEQGNEANKNIQPILEELLKYATVISDKYTDWLVY